ncbi:GNAT family N-acetyltransferase [Pseudomonas fontis]|uniref:GNAT family N-acetyltransferase n=1 Tax=Pseudomonas fontis TaxID=2942633 RepID=A0ABT5NYW5_9PSED|nr:GNAT family N-acetyltransferase [Pseudomonas fontis]MDD0976705.1 GNAT family N-acetyltransferase [Pseudomonas fontis]MDD0993304.1 GNAT family N-acetyltransferase [Pseudomonas fontis]
MSIQTLPQDRYPQVLEFIRHTEDADAQLFLSSALRNCPQGLQVYLREDDRGLHAVIALLPCLPPFAVPVILAAGDPDEALLLQVSQRHASPEMALGPKTVLERLTQCWPQAWLPQIGRRDEVLLKQFEAFPASTVAELTTRLAQPTDEATLIDYRIQMEKDSGVKLISSQEQARHTVRQLMQRQALYVIDVDGRLGGCAALTSSDEEHEQLGFIFVDAKHRLRGVSDRLLSDVCTGIHQRQRKPLTFTCVSGPLRNRLGEIGFRPVGEHLKLYFGQGC